jgi:hypothetical protein
MTIDIKKLRADHVAKLQEGFTKALDEFNPDQALETLTARLSDAQQQAVWNALGLQDRWGRWEVNTVSGKASPIGQWITAEIQDKLRAFMQELVKDEIDNIKAGMRTKIKTLIIKEIKAQAEWQLEKLVESTVEDVAKKLIDEVREEIEQELGL